MSHEHSPEYAYLTVPPDERLRPCVGLVLTGMAARARVGVGGLDEAVTLLEEFHGHGGPTRFRFALAGEGVVAEVDEAPAGEEGGKWRTVVELVS